MGRQSRKYQLINVEYQTAHCFVPRSVTDAPASGGPVHLVVRSGLLPPCRLQSPQSPPWGVESPSCDYRDVKVAVPPLLYPGLACALGRSEKPTFSDGMMDSDAMQRGRHNGRCSQVSVNSNASALTQQSYRSGPR